MILTGALDRWGSAPRRSNLPRMPGSWRRSMGGSSFAIRWCDPPCTNSRRSERRAAHRALADACGEAEPEQCAWHLAEAALGPDEGSRRRSKRPRVRLAALGLRGRGCSTRRARTAHSRQGVRLRRLAAAADALGEPVAPRRPQSSSTRPSTGRATGASGHEALRLRGAVEYFTGRGDPRPTALLEAVDAAREVGPGRSRRCCGRCGQRTGPHTKA